MKQNRRMVAFLLSLAVPMTFFGQNNFTGTVLDMTDHSPIVGATIMDTRTKKVIGVTDINGRFSLKNIPSEQVSLSCVGYRTLTLPRSASGTYYLQQDAKALGEVVVTAQESHSLTSASVIQKHAIDHLQPSSFSDLLELLPGGRASDPSLGTPNIISLREVPVASSDYATSALGTRFLLDGTPISMAANMQFLTGATDNQSTSRDFTNMGVDMRSISTDDIESVEIVRGIPSVEYGDLSSGLVKVRRRKGGNDISGRFKADMDSKLFYLSKGFEWKPQRLTLNLSADYLDSKTDPRNLLENYKRLTFSARLGKTWVSTDYKMDGEVNLDYGGSFDNDKVDPELNYGGVDRYKSGYNRYALSTSLNIMSLRARSVFRGAELLASLSYEKDVTERTRLVQLNGETPAATSRQAGEGDATLIYPYTYTGYQKVDGRPLSLYLKANATLSVPSESLSNRLLAGLDYQSDKNYGDGQVFDALHPLYPELSTRPRRYKDMPGSHILSAYAEESMGINIGRNKLEMEGGVRAQQMVGLPAQYALHNKIYIDPRANIGWTFPALRVGGHAMTFQLGGGVGQHTLFPTVDQLYPDNIYLDLVELNYYHPNRDYRRIYMQTYVIDPTNRNLRAARNMKWEIRGDVNWRGNRLTVTYFREDMKSGFRTMSTYAPYHYKMFDASGLDPNTLTARPDVSTLPYTDMTSLLAYGQTENGSRTLKRGVEYTLSTMRFPVINTRLTINGAWFKTEYRNSQVIEWKPSQIVDGHQLQLVGIYADDDGYIREMHNTNFTFDTDIPRLQLGFSISAQCQWMTARQNMYKDSNPVEYMDAEGTIHPFEAADAQDAMLHYLVRNYNSTMYQRETVPFSMNLNMKATKRLLHDKLMVALFVNKLWDSHRSYVRNNFTIRRYVTPYFGLELNFKI
jgi:hypothetical protein